MCQNKLRYSLFLIFLSVNTFAQIQSDTLLQCGDAEIYFYQKSYTDNGICLLNVHEDESTSVAAGKWLIDSVKQSRLVHWTSQGERFVRFTFQNQLYQFDPNRIYTRQGIVHTLGKNNLSSDVINSVEKIANQFTKRYVDSSKVIIALHNNTDGGGLSVKSYLPGAIYANEARWVHVSKQQDPDDFFFTTEQDCYTFLKANGFNVVLQNNEKVTDDGSLSVYCAGKKISYVNVEAQKGHLQQQKKMLAAIWLWIPKN